MKIKMHVTAQSCVLFLWMSTLTLVKSKDCTLLQFLQGPLFDKHFDTSNLQANYSGGRQVRVSCNIGYSGFFKLTCVEGQWQSRGTKCQPRSCGHPGDAQFADFHLENREDFVFGAKVVYTCQKGYQMISRTNFRYCMAEGWDGLVPVCEALLCSVVDVDNNVQVYGAREEAAYGNVLRFSCKYNSDMLVGSPEMYCDENGQWSGVRPKCVEIKCLVPVIENGDVPGYVKEYKQDDVLHFRCNSRFTPTESRPSKCKKIGIRAEWSPTPACEPVRCRLTLPPLTGTSYEPISRNLFSPGDEVRVSCGERHWIVHRLQTSVETTCKEDGMWTVEPICQEVTCRNQRPREVYYWEFYWQQQIKMGHSAKYRCNSNYIKPGGENGLATCTRNGFTPNPLCQEILCNREAIPNTDIVQNDKLIYKNNEKAHYVCKNGHRGSFTLTCTKKGWTGFAECIEITCSSLSYMNAVIVGGDLHQYKYNEQVEYVCNNGYEGRFTLTCGETDWTGTPRCTEKMCKKLRIDNAYITHAEQESYRHNDRVQYACRYGNERRFTVTCEENVWTGIESCSACPQAEVLHGFVVGPYNDTVYYTCDEGYKLFTKGWWGVATCKDGIWSGLQQCIKNEMCGEIPEILHGKVTPPRGQNINARVTCDRGFDAVVTHLTCQKGEWLPSNLSPETICTSAADPCQPPLPVENAVVVTSFQKVYLSDATVTYKCRAQYTTTDGQDTIQCKNGVWKNKEYIKCTPYCDKLEDKTITFTADKERYMDGDVINYQCVVPGVDGTAKCVNNKWIKSGECEASTQDQ